MKPTTCSVWTISVRAAFVALLLGFGSAGSASAQHEACYIPDVGVIYLINKAGLPSACLTGHTGISWTDGDITAVSAGFGLTGGAGAGVATLAVNTGLIQRRVSGTCAPGSSIRVIGNTGGVTCELDAGTAGTFLTRTVTVTAGTILTTDLVCPTGQRVMGGGVAAVATSTTLLWNTPLNSTTWRVQASIPAGSDAFTIRVVCLRN